jgi:hypothetical protein
MGVGCALQQAIRRRGRVPGRDVSPATLRKARATKLRAQLADMQPN